MSVKYWKTIEEELKRFWKPGEDIVLFAMNRIKDSRCELCGHEPITNRHVLLNTQNGRKMSVGRICVVNIRKKMEELGDRKKIGCVGFGQMRKAADSLNKKTHGTAEIMALDSSLDLIENILSSPDSLDTEEFKSILSDTSQFESGRGCALHSMAADILHKRLMDQEEADLPAVIEKFNYEEEYDSDDDDECYVAATSCLPDGYNDPLEAADTGVIEDIVSRDGESFEEFEARLHNSYKNLRRRFQNIFRDEE